MAGIDLEPPGEWPFTRGPYPTMYRGRPWTIRQYAGFGSAEETNARFRYLLDRGQTGLSVAFDLPTQLGYDSDHPRSAGEVGRSGVAIDSLADMERVFDGIPLERGVDLDDDQRAGGSAAPPVRAVAERQGVPGAELRGTVQNDVLKEYVARGNYIFPPRPVDADHHRSLRVLPGATAALEHDLGLRLPHPRGGLDGRAGAGVHARERDRLLRGGGRGRTSPDEFGERFSFFFNAHNDFFQEVAKFRAARTLWARIMRERFGAANPRAQALRFHAQTGGSTLTAQQPENNIVRVAIQALSAVCGGAQSLHTNGFDEALALPTEHSAQIALRTQQIIQHEAGTTGTADPLGGSYYLESLTKELEERAWELIERVDEFGGAVPAIEAGFVQGEIEDSAFRDARRLESGDRIIVGVNEFADAGEQAEVELLRIGPELEARQVEPDAAAAHGS